MKRHGKWDSNPGMHCRNLRLMMLRSMLARTRLVALLRKGAPLCEQPREGTTALRSFFPFHGVFILVLANWVQLLGATGSSLPSFSADVAGAFHWLELTGSPPLQTRMQANVDAEGRAELILMTTGEGVAITVEAGLPVPSNPGTWKIVRGEIDLAIWERFVAEHFAATVLPQDLEAHGVVHLVGHGSWQDGNLSGVLSATLHDGKVLSVAEGWAVEGLELLTELQLNDTVPQLRSSHVTAKSFSVAGIAGTALEVAIVGKPDGAWQVLELRLETLGGTVAAESFLIFPAKLAAAVTINLKDLDLSQLANLVPQALTSAGGHLSGRLGFEWSKKSGFTPKEGRLRLGANEGATLRLANAPGFLSDHVSEKINLVPAWMGPVAKILAQENPAYLALRQIESGRTPLKVEKLEIDLYPDGPEAPRSAQINITASPASGSAVKTVRFNVRVLGPLDEVLKLGLNNRVGMQLDVEK